MSKKAEKLAEREEAREILRRYLPPGSVVYGIVRDVSRSGMSRTITFHYVDPKTGRFDEITGRVAEALGMRVQQPRSFRSSYGLVVGGCGMDMVFAVVNSLSYALHGLGSDNDEPPQRRARAGRVARGADRSPDSPARRAGYTLRSEGV